MLPTSTVRDSPGMSVKQLSARFMGRQFSLSLRYIHTQLAIFLVVIVRELPWKEQVSPGSALVLFFMGTKKQLLELTTLSRVRRSILMKPLWVKLAYSVLLKRWTRDLSNGFTVFSTVCLTLVAYPAKVMMASWQWQLKVLLQSFTMQVTQSPVALSWMVWMISCSQEFLTLQCAALYVPKQSTVAQEVTGQTSFSCQQRLPMLQGLLRRRVVMAISRAYDCMTCEKYEMWVILDVAQEQLQVYPGIKMCPLGWRSCRRSTQLSLLEGQSRSSARVNLCRVEISGNACMPYSELKRPTYSSYSSIGAPAPHTLQKWISPEERVFVVEDETDGEVSQQYTSGCSSLSTLGRTPLKTSEYICSTSFFWESERPVCHPHSCQPIHTSLFPFHKPMEGWCLILFTLSLISASILARMSGELGQSAHANMRSCQMSIPASSMLSQNSSFSNCPPPHRRIMLNLPKRAYFLIFSQMVLLVLARDISGGMQLPPRMQTSYPLRLKVKEVPLQVLLVSWMTLMVLMPVLMADWKISCVFRFTSLTETVRRLGCPRSHVHQMLSQMLAVMLKGRLREELVVDLIDSVFSQMDTLLALRFTCRVRLQLAN